VAGFPPRRPGFNPRSDHVRFVVDKVALGQVFPPEYFGFPLSISFHRCSITRKNKKKTDHLSLLSSSQGCAIGLKTAVHPQHLLRGPSPHTHKLEHIRIYEKCRARVTNLLFVT
jgi:hypothetical protein